MKWETSRPAAGPVCPAGYALPYAVTRHTAVRLSPLLEPSPKKTGAKTGSGLVQPECCLDLPLGSCQLRDEPLWGFTMLAAAAAVAAAAADAAVLVQYVRCSVKCIVSQAAVHKEGLPANARQVAAAAAAGTYTGWPADRHRAGCAVAGWRPMVWVIAGGLAFFGVAE